MVHLSIDKPTNVSTAILLLLIWVNCTTTIQKAIHWLITFIRSAFSKAAATLSLSANCLLTAVSEVCVPGVISTVTLNFGGNDRNNFTRIERPIKVAILQWGMVGVNWTNTWLFSLSTLMRFCWTTCSSSNVNGCSGSLISRTKSKIIRTIHWLNRQT